MSSRKPRTTPEAPKRKCCIARPDPVITLYGDSAYSSQKDLIAQAAPKARDFTNQKGFRNRGLTAREQVKNSRKSSVRAKVEHAFLIIKRIFGFAKVSYRGMAKNGNRLFVVAALANLFMVRHHLLRLQQGRCV